MKVGIIMGSNSDLPVMRQAAEILTELGVEHEMTVVSAHRTPDRMVQYARYARDRGLGSKIPGVQGGRVRGSLRLTERPAARCPHTHTAGAWRRLG